jgi:Mn2+/Fe2+ NRAMP family transporter
LNVSPAHFQRYLKILGPGFITGASDYGPSGIGTYAVAGGQLGYATLWTALVTFPLVATRRSSCLAGEAESVELRADDTP